MHVCVYACDVAAMASTRTVHNDRAMMRQAETSASESEASAASDGKPSAPAAPHKIMTHDEFEIIEAMYN